jgi:hypothetical protein
MQDLCIYLEALVAQNIRGLYIHLLFFTPSAEVGQVATNVMWLIERDQGRNKMKGSTDRPVFV